MALNDSRMDMRLGWVIALIGILLTGAFGLMSFSGRAGALETRVSAIEQRQNGTDADIKRMDDDMKHVLDSLARIEQKVEDLKK